MTQIVEDSGQTAVPPVLSSTEASILADVPLFAGLDARSLDTIEAFAFRRTFQPGELIVEEGHTGNGLYVIVDGSVEVIRGLDSDHPQVVATLSVGEPFGELALLGEWKRTASVRTLVETTCIGMDRWVFLAHLRTEPELAIKMLQFLAQRLAETDQKVFG